MFRNDSAGAIINRVRTASQERLHIDKEWVLNSNYIVGNSHGLYGAEDRFQKTKNVNDALINKETFNIMRNYYTSYKSRLTEYIPRPKLSPLNASQTEINRNKKLSNLLDYILGVNEFEDLYEKIAEDAVVKGVAIVKVSINKDGKSLKELAQKRLENVMKFSTDEERVAIQKEIDSITGYEKDVSFDIVHPTNFFVDTAARRTFKDSSWCAEVSYMEADVAVQKYGHHNYRTTNWNALGSTGTFVGYDVYRRFYGRRISSSTVPDQVEIIEYYERPSCDYPEGRMVLLVGEIVIHDTTLPYRNAKNGKRDFPYVWFSMGNVPDSLYGDSPLKDLHSIQRRVNRVRNRITTSIDKAIFGTIMMRESSISGGTKISNKTGQVWVIKNGREFPRVLQYNAVNPSLFSEAMTLQNNDLNLTGPINTTASTGTSKSGVRSEGMLDSILANENKKLKTPILNLVRMVKDMTEKALHMYKEEILPSQKIKYIPTRVFQGANLGIIQKNDIDFIEITVEDEMTIHMSREERLHTGQEVEQTVINLLGAGLQDPFMINEIIKEKQLGFIDTQKLIPGGSDINKAERENQLLLEIGEPGTYNEYQNHQIHLRVHKDLLDSEEFENLARNNPVRYKELQDKLIAHMQEHQLEQQSQMAAMQQQQAQPQG